MFEHWFESWERYIVNDVFLKYTHEPRIRIQATRIFRSLSELNNEPTAVMLLQKAGVSLYPFQPDGMFIRLHPH